MYLRRLRVSGYRSGADNPVEVVLPGRFSVVLGANSSGKTTFAEAAYLGHSRVFPRIGRPSAAALARVIVLSRSITTSSAPDRWRADSVSKS